MPEPENPHGAFIEAAKPTLGTLIARFEELYRENRLDLLTPDERRAQLDQSIAASEALQARGKGLSL